MPTNGVAPDALTIASPRVRHDPTKEYVGGGGEEYSAFGNYIRRLPTPDDDLDNLIGNDVYVRMGNDEQIASSTFLEMMMVLRRPMTLDLAFADVDSGADGDDGKGDKKTKSPGSNDYDKSVLVRDYCQRCLDNLESNGGSAFRVNWELLHNAMRFGNAVGEPVWEQGRDEDKGRYILKSIKIKPRHVYSFVVNRVMELLGLAAFTGDYAQWRESYAKVTDTRDALGLLAGELPNGWEFIERDKFCVLSLLTQNNDPRGTSWWRTIYNAWYQKMRRLRQLDLYARRFGLPILFGTTAPDAGDQWNADSSGNEDKSVPKISAEQAYLQRLLGVKEGDAIAAPDGTKLNVVQNTNDGGALASALRYHDSQIVKGITFQKLATSPDPSQAKASSEVHQDILNVTPMYLKNELTTMWRNDILWPMVRDNLGAEYKKYLPKPNLGRIDPEDLAKLLTALGRALASGGLHYSMLPEIWSDWGLPPADIEAWMQEIQQEKAVINTINTQTTTGGAAGAATDPNAPVQTDQQRYEQQEVGKAISRARARRTAGRQGSSFSEGQEETK